MYLRKKYPVQELCSTLEGAYIQCNNESRVNGKEEERVTSIYPVVWVEYVRSTKNRFLPSQHTAIEVRNTCRNGCWFE